MIRWAELHTSRCFSSKRTSRVFAAGLLLLLIAEGIPAQPKPWSIELARTLMTRFPDPNSYPWKTFSYPQGFMLEGFLKLRSYTGDKDSAYYKYVMKYANDRVDANGNIQGFGEGSLDDMMPGAILCWAYGQTRQQKYRTAAGKILQAHKNFAANGWIVSDGVPWHCSGCPGELWIDGTLMAEMLLIRYAQYIGDSTYCFTAATKHLLAAYKRLRKSSNNLLYHAWDEDKNAGWANNSTGLSPEVWGEGLGWYALALVETMEALPLNHPKRDSIGILINSLATGLKNAQDQSGCWWDIVDKGGQQGNFTDASGTSMFIYMLQKGIESGTLVKATYDPVVTKAYECLKTKAKLNADNLVDIYDAHDGLPVQSGYSAYVNYPKTMNAKEAVAAFLWATAIVEKPGQTTVAAGGRGMQFVQRTLLHSGPVLAYTVLGRKIGAFATPGEWASRCKKRGASGVYIIRQSDIDAVDVCKQ